MLIPRLNNCVDCTTIPSLLGDIDCKLTQLAKSEYNNVVFILNHPKLVNSDYSKCFTVKQIASKVKTLIHK